MEYEYKNVSPYKGLIGTCIILILFPTIVCVIFYNAIIHFHNLSEELIRHATIGLGCGVSILFHFSCIIAGLFKTTFSIVVKRILSFFLNLTISFKVALQCYKEDLINEGIAFWPSFIIICANAVGSIYHLYKFFDIYFN